MAQFTDRKSVIDWLNGHKRQEIRLTAGGSTLRVVGRNSGIEELDACSTDVYLAELEPGLPGLHLTLTLHDEALALHLLAEGPPGAPPRLSFPLHVPYAKLRLDRADAPEGAAWEEPEFSPYELLFNPRSD